MSSSEPNTQLLDIGKQCSHSSCLLVDFLPFKCQHCQLSFCQEHFGVDAHKCSKYDDSKHNRVAPNCPLCNVPVAFRQGEDPNVRMDYHLENECSVVTGKVKSKSMPVCSRSTCKKVLFSPIRCENCRQQFCVSHRFPGDHNCSSAVPATKRPQQAPANNRLADFSSTAKNLNVKASAAGDAAMGAVKKSISEVKAAAASTSASTSKPTLPFNKMDRRAKAERRSKLKAMQARAQKGLLSEEEQVILAAEEASAAKDKDDCIVM